MADLFEFISPNEQAALLAIGNPQYHAKARTDLSEAGFKVMAAATHEDFIDKFYRTHYRVVVLDVSFGAPPAAENRSLIAVQKMLMPQRRHAVFLLIGQEFRTMDAMQAFQRSVQVVVNPVDMPRIRSIVERAVTDNDLFLQVFRETQDHSATWGK